MAAPTSPEGEGRHAHASRVRGRSTAVPREARKGGATAAQLQVSGDEPDGEFEKGVRGWRRGRMEWSA